MMNSINKDFFNIHLYLIFIYYSFIRYLAYNIDYLFIKTMKEHFFPIELLLLFLFSLECIFVLQDEHKAFFWVAILLVAFFSYTLEGARPYTPVFFGIAIADYLELDILQKILLFLAVLLVTWIKFYHISIAGKGPYNAGYRYYKHDDIELSVFYPSMADGQHPKWIPSERYDMVFYDIAHVDPTKMRIPFKIFNFLVSYLIKIKMPVLGDASLCVDDHNKDDRWNIVVFSHGLGSNMNNYSALCGWWASHGYIVVSIQHHKDKVRIQFDKQLLKHLDIVETILYNGRNADLKIRAQQMETVITEILDNNLLGKIFNEVKSIDIQGIYFAGQSYGGATVLETTANMIIKNNKPAILKGLICLDAWFFPLSSSTYQHLKNQNILLLNSESFFSILPSIYCIQDKMGKIRDANKQTIKAFIITKTDHLSTCDFVFALGTLLSIINSVKLQRLAIPVLQFHQIVISLFMEGKPKEEILTICNKYANQKGLISKGVSLVEESRYSSKK